MVDTETEQYYQAQLDRLRAELAVPACSGDCQNCPLNTTVPETAPVVYEASSYLHLHTIHRP